MFELLVCNRAGLCAGDRFTITVQNVNDPPLCELARQGVEILWPPDYKLAWIEIVEVTEYRQGENHTATTKGKEVKVI